MMGRKNPQRDRFVKRCHLFAPAGRETVRINCWQRLFPDHVQTCSRSTNVVRLKLSEEHNIENRRIEFSDCRAFNHDEETGGGYFQSEFSPSAPAFPAGIVKIKPPTLHVLIHLLISSCLEWEGTLFSWRFPPLCVIMLNTQKRWDSNLTNKCHSSFTRAFRCVNHLNLIFRRSDSGKASSCKPSLACRRIVPGTFTGRLGCTVLPALTHLCKVGSVRLLLQAERETPNYLLFNDEQRARERQNPSILLNLTPAGRSHASALGLCDMEGGPLLSPLSPTDMWAETSKWPIKGLILHFLFYSNNFKKKLLSFWSSIGSDLRARCKDVSVGESSAALHTNELLAALENHLRTDKYMGFALL